jgi:hypothetical protein
MGVFSKLKNIFYDEEIVEDNTDVISRKETIEDDGFTKELEIKPKIEEIKVIKQDVVKEEPKIVIEEEPKKIEKEPEERELFRSERKFNFTEFDDDDLDLPPRKSVLNTETRSRVVENKSVEPDQPKVFKPSPIISPIYGILDKDYKKEEIVSRKENSAKEIEDTARNYDSVRRKAYGTLEDDLEDTLNSMNKITPEEIKKEEKVEVKEENNQIDDILNKMEKTSSVSVGELEDKLELENFDEDEEENVDKTMADSTLEHDLFNLIDSMYDDKEE